MVVKPGPRRGDWDEIRPGTWERQDTPRVLGPLPKGSTTLTTSVSSSLAGLPYDLSGSSPHSLAVQVDALDTLIQAIVCSEHVVILTYDPAGLARRWFSRAPGEHVQECISFLTPNLDMGIPASVMELKDEILSDSASEVISKDLEARISGSPVGLDATETFAGLERPRKPFVDMYLDRAAVITLRDFWTAEQYAIPITPTRLEFAAVQRYDRAMHRSIASRSAAPIQALRTQWYGAFAKVNPSEVDSFTLGMPFFAIAALGISQRDAPESPEDLISAAFRLRRIREARDYRRWMRENARSSTLMEETEQYITGLFSSESERRRLVAAFLRDAAASVSVSFPLGVSFPLSSVVNLFRVTNLFRREGLRLLDYVLEPAMNLARLGGALGISSAATAVATETLAALREGSQDPTAG